MKTFTLSKKDLTYMQPLDATMQGLNTAIQVYVINEVFKRLGIESTSRARYNLDKGELYVMEEKDMVPPPSLKQTPKDGPKPEQKAQATVQTVSTPEPEPTK